MNHLLFLNVGGSEVVIIALFVLLFFGSKSIPEFMRGLGKMSRELKDAMNGIEREVRTTISEMDEEVKKTDPLKQLEEKSTPPEENLPDTLLTDGQGQAGKDEPKKDEQTH